MEKTKQNWLLGIFFVAIFSVLGSPWAQGQEHAFKGMSANERVHYLLSVPELEAHRLIEQFDFEVPNPFSELNPEERLELLKSSTPDQALHLMQQQTLYELVLERAVQTDALTRLLNRRAFDRIKTRLPTQDVYVVALDLDHFSSVNNTYGHPKGDEVIQAAAEVFRDKLRPTDAAIRMGGEEFIILLELDDFEAVQEIVNRIHTAISQKIFKSPDGKTTFSVTVSIGVSKYISGQQNQTLEKVAEKADKALYLAKVSRNTIFWDNSCGKILRR